MVVYIFSKLLLQICHCKMRILLFHLFMGDCRLEKEKRCSEDVEKVKGSVEKMLENATLKSKELEEKVFSGLLIKDFLT